jgi:hypothetical protein
MFLTQTALLAVVPLRISERERRKHTYLYQTKTRKGFSPFVQKGRAIAKNKPIRKKISHSSATTLKSSLKSKVILDSRVKPWSDGQVA